MHPEPGPERIPNDGIVLRAETDLEALALGVTLLGCGGGGRVDQITAYLRHRSEEVLATVIGAESTGRSLQNVVAVGYVGATTVMDEKLPAGEELVRAVSALERWAGVKADMLMPALIGGVCGLAAITAAQQLKLPVVDADFEGRAMPRLDQFSYAIAGGPAMPFAVAGTDGLSMVIDHADPAKVEAVVRAVVARTGGWAAFAIGPMPYDGLREFAIVGSVTAALIAGRAMLASKSCEPDSLGAQLGGRTLAVGRVIAASRTTDEKSFVRASFAVLDSREGSVVRIEAGSEYLLVLIDGQPVVSCPDIIIVIDARTREPISCADLHDRLEVIVVAVPGAPWWKSKPERLSEVGPRAFGIDSDPIVLEGL